MSIGLFDADMDGYTHVPFNLELMKLSTYYKRKNQIVGMSKYFTPDRYTKFIFRKDYYDGIFPAKFTTIKNIEYGGRAFSPEYISLGESIEGLKPDKYIYESKAKEFCINKSTENSFKTMMNAEHFRLSLDNRTVWDDFARQINETNRVVTMFCHDYDLNSIKDSDIAIREILKGKSKRYLATKFPIQVFNEADLLKWSQFPPSEAYFILQYNGMIDDEFFVEFIERTKGTSIIAQTKYNVTYGCRDEEEFIRERLPRLFYQISYLRMKRKNILLIYDNNFFSDKRWERVIKLLEVYQKSATAIKKEYFERKINFDTMYSFVRNLKPIGKTRRENISVEEARDLFRLVANSNYDVFKDFYECSTVKLKGGTLQP